MNIGTQLDELRATLDGVEDGGLCAQWILEDLTGTPCLALPGRRGDLIEDSTVRTARAWAARVAAGEPIQYVLGWTSFRGHRIRTDRRALIPRPETEELVSHARAHLTGPIRFADVGTGTGCIAIALCLEHAGASAWAIDREAEALTLAAENVTAHRLDHCITLRQGDLLEGIADRTLDLVVSNPPYVAEAEMPELPVNVRDYEPSSALESGRDGLDAIRRLIPQAWGCLKPGGRLLLEMGESQGTAVAAALEAGGFAGVQVHTDLSGRERIAEGEKAET